MRIFRSYCMITSLDLKYSNICTKGGSVELGANRMKCEYGPIHRSSRI